MVALATAHRKGYVVKMVKAPQYQPYSVKGEGKNAHPAAYHAIF